MDTDVGRRMQIWVFGALLTKGNGFVLIDLSVVMTGD